MHTNSTKHIHLRVYVVTFIHNLFPFPVAETTHINQVWTEICGVLFIPYPATNEEGVS